MKINYDEILAGKKRIFGDTDEAYRKAAEKYASLYNKLLKKDREPHPTNFIRHMGKEFNGKWSYMW